MADVSEKDLTDAVLNRWATGNPPRYVAAVQVNNGAGYSYTRTLDAIVLDTWPSSGIIFHGLEMKTTRSDLRRELRNPRKYREFEPFLDRFSVVAAKGVLGLDLLPDKWGAYVLKDDGNLHTLRAPLPLHDDHPDFPRGVVAAFSRALVERSLSEDAKKRAYERGKAHAEERAQRKIEDCKRKLNAMNQSMVEFEEKSGLKLKSWSAGEMGEAVSLIMAGGLERRLRFVHDIRDVGERMVQLADELDALKERYEGG